MASQRKTHVLLFSLFAVLITGGFVGYFIQPYKVSEDTNPEPIPVGTDSIRAVGGMIEYTEMATTIVIGEVVKITDLSERTGITYPRKIIDAEIQVTEVLKGDSNESKVIVTTFEEDENAWTEDSISLNIGEKILVMLAKDAEGNNVIFAGPSGKFVIDENGNVKNGMGETIPLEKLKAEILVAMEASKTE